MLMWAGFLGSFGSTRQPGADVSKRRAERCGLYAPQLLWIIRREGCPTRCGILVALPTWIMMQLTRITYQSAVSATSAGERATDSTAAKLTISVLADTPETR